MHLAIISFGFEAVIRSALERMDLIQYFDDDLIIGNDSNMLQDVFGNKAKCLQKMASAHDLGENNRVLFVDDDENNTTLANNLNVAETLWIRDKNGISFEQMQMIEQRVGVYEKSSVAAR